jgi:hypothetical protein
VALASAPFLDSAMPGAGRYPLLALDGAEPPLPTLPPGAPPGRPGTVRSVEVDPGGDEYAATVSAVRPSALLVKTSYHPRWAAEVDGRPVPVVPVAPGLLAVPVPAGVHQVTVHFAGFPVGWRLALVAVGIAALVGLALVDAGRLRVPSVARGLAGRVIGPRGVVLRPVADEPTPEPVTESGRAG